MNDHTPRRRLALLIADPGADYSQSVITGVRDQCARYNYDLLVFSTMVKVCHPDKVYLDGERNIFRLINYDRVDGVLLASLALYEDQVREVLAQLEEDLRAHCKKPVVSLDLPFADYPAVCTDDRRAIRRTVEHLVQVHGCRRLYCLTGQQDYSVSEERADAFCEQMQAEGLGSSRENVFYGNFWYTGGEAFAERLLSGELPLPDAVVCANDYMAIGLTNRLISGGIGVPEQVRVTGYDATKDAVFNTVSVTTYAPDVYSMAAGAVNMMHAMLEPGRPAAEIAALPQYGLRIGESCGCRLSAEDLRRMHGTAFNPDERRRNADGSLAVNDLRGLHESYMFETLSVIQDHNQILQKITDVSYLLQPYRRFYLVLRHDWLDPDRRRVTGYPDSMRCVIRCIPQNETESENEQRYFGDSAAYAFPTAQMLPALDEPRDEPVVFYFLPSHFSDDTVGYAVLQTAMDAKRTADEISALWLRNVNSALQMVRVVSKLTDYSVRDPMTGLLNRRGMEMMFARRCAQLRPDDRFVLWMIDMDGLKYINDRFGHAHGDTGILAITEAIRAVSGEEDIAVRAGGDEFVLIAAGNLTEADGQARADQIGRILAERNAAQPGQPYEITASIGFVCFPAAEPDVLDEQMREADRRMYDHKTARKKQRRS